MAGFRGQTVTFFILDGLDGLDGLFLTPPKFFGRFLPKYFLEQEITRLTRLTRLNTKNALPPGATAADRLNKMAGFRGQTVTFFILDGLDGLDGLFLTPPKFFGRFLPKYFLEQEITRLTRLTRLNTKNALPPGGDSSRPA